MSTDIYQLIIHLARLQHGQHQQIVSINSTENQTMQSRSELSSDGPNASLQVANSNIHQTIYNFHFSPMAIANGDHGGYPNNQDSHPVDLDTAEDVAKKAVFEVYCASDDLTEATEKLANRTAMLSEWVTEVNWPTFKLGLVSEPAITLGDIAIKHCMSTIELSQSIIEFGQSSVEFGESTYSNFTIIRMALSESLSDGSTSIFEETIVRYKESFTTFMKRLPMYDTTALEESARAHENSASQLSDFIGHAVDFATLEEVAIALGHSANTVGKVLTAFGGLVMAYGTALDGVLLALTQRLAMSNQ